MENTQQTHTTMFDMTVVEQVITMQTLLKHTVAGTTLKVGVVLVLITFPSTPPIQQALQVGLHIVLRLAAIRAMEQQPTQ